jgi:Astacin (Peptidase family M12A)
MPRTYKICSPFAPDVGHHKQSTRLTSEQAATDERLDNIRILPVRPGGLMNIGGADILHSGPIFARAAVERLKLWENGRHLRVKFLDGAAEVQNKVAAIAKEWEAVANITFDFVSSGAAEIRISFAEQGFSWSAVGSDALTTKPAQPTMNFGWLEPTTSLREYQRVVRHEFGHALGMIHEHQNPAALGQIPWDKPKVYAYYAQQSWSRADVDANIFDVYAEDSTNHTAFDPTSIMEYAIPDSLTIGSYAIGWNTELSSTDVDFMRRQYPKGAAAMVELTVGTPRTAAALSAGGEVDTFHFDVTAPGKYIMTTEGTIDTVMMLHGPNDRGAILTWDDDRGKGKNARIVRKLFAGSYWLSVRHKDPASTGPYTIGVKKSRWTGVD